jgi:hypothetical protein
MRICSTIGFRCADNIYISASNAWLDAWISMDEGVRSYVVLGVALQAVLLSASLMCHPPVLTPDNTVRHLFGKKDLCALQRGVTKSAIHVLLSVTCSATPLLQLF